MQNITVEIQAKGFTGLTAENIEKALNHYFGSPTLGVSFSVTEAAQQSVQRTAEWVCPECYRHNSLDVDYCVGCETRRR